MSNKLSAVAFISHIKAETVKALLKSFGLTVERTARTNRLGPVYKNYGILT